jgi:hypothetical protein
MNNDKITNFIESSQFIRAYELILNGLEHNPQNKQLLELSKSLSSHVRSRCMELACNKATDMSVEAYESEALLRIIIKLNGESIYG